MAARRLNPSERLDWLRLIRTENVGPVTFYQLLRRFGSAAAALDALPRLAGSGGRRAPLAVYSRDAAERELAGFDKAGVMLLAWGEPDYPQMLAAIDDAPPLLTMRGRPEMLRRRTIAIVGARNASANGRRLAREMAGELGAQGLVIASGLARGIDAAAHLGALPTGTVAVLGGGVDIVYPEENRALYDAIAAEGAILAEPPLGTVPQARHFPRRNRIISGLSLGILVVEAAARSGSLITARFALDQGREVFAVPGSPLDPRCRGTNDLIRHGATLTESAEDVLNQLPSDALQPGPRGLRSAPEPAENPVSAEAESGDFARTTIIERLGPSPVAVDELVRQCQFSPATVVTILLELELAGRLERHPGNQVSLL
ncbi:MAG: DNA-protecting protein DprA [Alphaproteobacteria bacterium]|nr:DNA-protecting protein DprA [Alphaproteobacteria bacterium]